MASQTNLSKPPYSQHPRTARPNDYQPPGTPSLPASANKIMATLSQSISTYSENLHSFASYLQQSVRKAQSIRCKCCDVLSHSVGKLKENFKQFANEWKVELPTICAQFMEIVQKICTLYQQQVERLKQLNQKWQFSYTQLLKVTSSGSLSLKSTNALSTANNTKDNSRIPSPKNEINPTGQTVQRKCRKPVQKQNMQTKSNTIPISGTNQIQSRGTQLGASQKQIINITDYLMKIKDSQLSLMRQQITELFDQQDRSEENSFHHNSKQQRVHNSIEKNKLNIKILTEEEKANEEIKQFRLRTMSDELMTSSNPNAIMSVHSTNLQINLHNPTYSKDSISSKSSQQNSRKNSLVFKDQFWQTLKGNIGTKPSCGNKSMNKENASLLSKERNSIASKEDQKNEKSNQEHGSSGISTIGSRLQDLKRNMYKNKAPIEWRS